MNHKERWARFTWILLASAILTWGCARQRPQVLPVGGDFTLTDQDGKPFELSSLHGKAVLVFFGYTTCPDACPVTMSKIASVYRHLGPDARRLKTVYISVDTQRDTPPVLKEYLTNFKSVDAVGLTGTVSQIDKVTALYGAEYEITPMAGMPASHHMYNVAHSTDVYLVDPQGRTRDIFEYDASVEALTKGVREVL